jgi:phage-related protein
MRRIIFYKAYFTDFYFRQTDKVQRKIDYVFDLVRTVERVPEKFLKHLTHSDGIYEIRVSQGNNTFRIMCFWDEGELIVLLNSFQKKSQKTPANEIRKAERLKKEYFEAKNGRKEKGD